MSAELITPQIRRTVRAIAQRELALPALVFLTGHRPLAFVTGQLLYALEPGPLLLGLTGWSDWAELLSDPSGPTQLLDCLIEMDRTSTT